MPRRLPRQAIQHDGFDVELIPLDPEDLVAVDVQIQPGGVGAKAGEQVAQARRLAAILDDLLGHVLHGAPTSARPATLLASHARFRVLADEAAAGRAAPRQN